MLNFSEILPAAEGEEAAVDLSDAISNRWFIESIERGTYPQVVLDGLGSHMPPRWQEDMATISAPIDRLGVNYYSRAIVSHDADAPWPSTRGHEGPLPKTQMGWEIYPEGLGNLLMRMARDYVGALPIFVTEDGMAWDDHVQDGEVEDTVRRNYVAAHLDAARQAIAGGPMCRASSTGRCWTITNGRSARRRGSGLCMSISTRCGARQRLPTRR